MGVLPLVLVSVVVGGSAAQLTASWYYWQHRHVDGLAVLTASGLGSGFGSITYVAALIVRDPSLTRLLFGAHFSGLCVATVGWFLFVLHWAEYLPTVRSNWGRVLGVPYALVVTATLYDALVVGADGESATVAAFEVTTSAGLTVPQLVLGPLGNAYSLLSLVVLLATLGVLFSFIREPEQRLYRDQNRLLLFGALGPTIVEILFRSLSVPFAAQPLTALPASLAIVIAVFRYGIFNVSPLTRESLVEDLDAGIVAYDTNGRIIDTNPLARSLLDGSDQFLGRPVEAVLADSSIDVEMDGDGPIGAGIDGREVTIEGDDGTRYFTVQRSPIETDGDQALAWGLLFSDITEQRTRERELDMLKQVFSRVLRHNLRNDMNVVGGTAAELVERTDGRDAELARRIVASSDILTDISEKARLVEKVVERPSDREAVDLAATVKSVIESIGSSHPAATFETDLPADLTVVAHPELDVAIENAIENSIEHARAEAVTVSVSASIEGEWCTLAIADDGPGIPEDELAPLDERSETPLQHASGVGLWLMQWVINRSNGTVSFEGSSDGTTVRMTLAVDEGTTDSGPETAVLGSSAAVQ